MVAFLRNYLLKHKVDHVVFDGCNKAFVESVKSIIGRRPYTVKNQIVNNTNVLYVIVKNSLFYLKLAVGVILRRLFVRSSKKSNQSNIDQLFLTRYPLHLNKHLYEDKYGEFVDKSGIYLVNLFTDGLHQNLSLSQYLKSTKFTV